MTNPRLSIIIVNFNTKDDCVRCVQSVRDRITGISREIVVCDNGSADGSVEAIRKEFPPGQFPWVHVIDNKDNLGFGRANNVGARSARGEILFFLNPDTLIVRGIEQMCTYLLEQKDTGMLGPVVVDQDNRVNVFYPPVYSNIFLQVADLVATPAARLVLSATKSAFNRRIQRGSVFDAGCVIGCAMMIRKDAWEAIGGFDDRIFMFGEEFDLCRRLRGKGYRVRFYPAAEIIHYGGHSSRRTPSDALVSMGAQSLKLLFRKHFRRSWRIRYRIEALTHIRQALSAYSRIAFNFFMKRDNTSDWSYARSHITRFKIMQKVLKEKE